MSRIILHVDIPPEMSKRIDGIASLMRVTRSQLVRWFIEDGILEYTMRIQQSDNEAKKEESTNGPERA